jgi:hypothetical protein
MEIKSLLTWPMPVLQVAVVVAILKEATGVDSGAVMEAATRAAIISQALKRSAIVENSVG